MGAAETRTLLQAMFGAHLSRAIGQTAEMGLADRIGVGQSRPVSELAAETGCHERALYRVMRYLASHGIFEETGRREFTHTDLSAAMRSDAEQSFRPAGLLMHWITGSLGEFDHTLKTQGSALAQRLGEPVFEFLSTHPEKAALFDAAMPSFHGGETEAMLESYDGDRGPGGQRSLAGQGDGHDDAALSGGHGAHRGRVPGAIRRVRVPVALGHPDGLDGERDRGSPGLR